MNWLNELRYTLKILGKNFRFTLLCVSVLFVGIAIVLPTYAMFDNLALKTPRLSPGDEYVVINKELVRPTFLSRYDAFHLQTFRDNAASFETLNAWRATTATISDGEYAEGFSGAEIEPALLQRVQVQPLRGRLLVPDDATGAPVALIGYEVWQTYYAAREDIVGHQSRINGMTRTIVGVMPEDFAFPMDQRVWLPLAVAPGANPGEGAEDLALVGILADGVGMADATTEIGLLQAGILADWAEQYEGIRTSRVAPYVYFNVAGGGVDSWGLTLVLGSIVLLVACNIGNLFVARGEERIQELAVRSALGATPARIARSLLLESFVVCGAGLMMGWLWAWFGLTWLEGVLVNMGGATLTEYLSWDLSLNGRMLTASALMVIVVWLGSGGLPAWRISRTNLNELLNSSGKGGLSEGGTTRLSKILVNIQLVLGCVLLTLGVTVQILAFSEEINVQPNGDRLYTGRFTLSPAMQADAQKLRSYVDTLGQALLNQPGIEDFAVTNAPPGGGSGGTQAPYSIEDQDLRVNDIWPIAHRVFVTDRYFDLIDADLLQGRDFGAEDTESGLPVAIIDQRLAARLWPGESAVGKRLQMNPDDNTPWLTIVGVVEPIVMEASSRSGEEGTPGIYRPLRQSTAVRQLRVLVGAADPAFDYLNTMRRAAAAADRDVPLTDIHSVRAVEEASANELTFTASAYYALILIAIYLTAAATYGLAARAAGRRRIETGIRMALGASPAACTRLFLKDGCRMVAYGLGIGGILAIIVSYVILAGLGNSTLAVRAIIPTALLLGLLMGGLVMLANYFPARKIVAMEPADALRYE